MTCEPDEMQRAEAEEIGVITPYHAQACKIRQLLKNIAPTTQVASVELFQGQVSQSC
jgi:helicase MOV-10